MEVGKTSYGEWQWKSVLPSCNVLLVHGLVDELVKCSGKSVKMCKAEFSFIYGLRSGSEPSVFQLQKLVKWR